MYNDRRSTVDEANDSYLCRTKEHCLVGIKGQIRRSNDTHLIHTNIDCDVIVGEEPEPDSAIPDLQPLANTPGSWLVAGDLGVHLALWEHLTT